MSSLSCRLCGEPIKFNDKHISERSGKKIPLDIDTEEPHDCPVWNGSQQYQPQQQQLQQQQQQGQRQQEHTQERRYYYYQCNKGCGQEIYFDANHSKNQSGKWIPLAKDTGLPHQCTEAELNYNKCYDLLLWLVYEVFIARQAMIWLFHIYL